MAKSQDGPIYPQMMPARRGLTPAAYWEHCRVSETEIALCHSPGPAHLEREHSARLSLPALAFAPLKFPTTPLPKVHNKSPSTT